MDVHTITSTSTSTSTEATHSWNNMMTIDVDNNHPSSTSTSYSSSLSQVSPNNNDTNRNTNNQLSPPPSSISSTSKSSSSISTSGSCSSNNTESTSATSTGTIEMFIIRESSSSVSPGEEESVMRNNEEEIEVEKNENSNITTNTRTNTNTNQLPFIIKLSNSSATVTTNNYNHHNHIISSTSSTKTTSTTPKTKPNHPKLQLILPELPSPNIHEESNKKISEDGSFHSDGFNLTPQGIKSVPYTLHNNNNNNNTNNSSNSINNNTCDLYMNNMKYKRDETILIREIGRGACGTVYRAVYAPALSFLAVKFVEVHDSCRRKQMVQELKVLYSMSKHSLGSPVRNVTASVTAVESSDNNNINPLSTDDFQHTNIGTGLGLGINGNGTGIDMSHRVHTTSRCTPNTSNVTDIPVSMDVTPSSSPAVSLSSSSSTAETETAAVAGVAGGDMSPYIVKFYDAYTDPEREAVGIVLEHMGGGSLQDLINRGLTLDENGAAVVAYSALQ
eukprot:gene11790-24704_t